MTLLIALTGSDGLVLAADGRGTFGDPRGVTAQNDTMQKAHIVAPHVGVLIAGSAELGSKLIDEVKQSISASGMDGVTLVMEHLRLTVCQRYNEWFPTVPPVVPIQAIQSGTVATRPDLAFLVAGYDDEEARLYTLASAIGFPPMLNSHGFAIQGVAQYALYLLNRLYEPDRSIEELTALAVYAITETAGQDGKVGGPVNVITIKPGEDGINSLQADAVENIHARNESRIQALRGSFYEGTN